MTHSIPPPASLNARSLIQLLASEDDEVVSIACYDIGEFARFYPNGRTYVPHHMQRTASAMCPTHCFRAIQTPAVKLFGPSQSLIPYHPWLSHRPRPPPQHREALRGEGEDHALDRAQRPRGGPLRPPVRLQGAWQGGLDGTGRGCMMRWRDGCGMCGVWRRLFGAHTRTPSIPHHTTDHGQQVGVCAGIRTGRTM